MKVEKLLIATGGYLKNEIRVEKIVLTDEDEVFLEDFEAEGFDIYVKEIIDEEAAGYEQGFCQVLVIDVTSADALVSEILKVTKP
jgi:hypothetical protein